MKRNIGNNKIQKQQIIKKQIKKLIKPQLM